MSDSSPNNILLARSPTIPSDFIPFDRADQELQNAFLDESLAQKEANIWAFKVSAIFGAASRENHQK